MEHNSGTIAPSPVLVASSSVHPSIHQLEFDAMKAMIISHPLYPNLTSAFLNCLKVGCSQEAIDDLARNAREVEAKQKEYIALNMKHVIHDSELDLFMESYEKVLLKCKEELETPLLEATEFIQRATSQLNSLTHGSMHAFSSVDQTAICNVEEEEQTGHGEMELPVADPSLEKQELRTYLLKKYGGCLSGLRQELSKKKKKGKLPKEARGRLLSWWDLHNKWPYPSETEKIALAQSTGLDQKQINNWFINQRKRHWKPSDEMQLNMTNAGKSQDAMCLYMGDHLFCE